MKVVGYTQIHGFLTDVLSLLLPPTCPGCGQGSVVPDMLCTACEEKLHRWPATRSFADRISTDERITLLLPRFVYEKGALVARLIHNFKYQRHQKVGHLLSAYYAAHLATCPDACAYDVVLPVPMHWWRLFVRGFNQSTIIAQHVANVLHIPLLEGVLLRARYTRRQVGMGHTQRWENVQGKFAVKQATALANKRVLLIDDVFTTGATTLACASLLLACGASTVGIGVLALRG